MAITSKLSHEVTATANGEPGIALIVPDDRVVIRGTGTSIVRLTDTEQVGLFAMLSKHNKEPRRWWRW